MCSVRDGCQLTIPARPGAAFRVGEVLKRVVAGRTSASLSPVRSVPLAPHTIHPCGHRSVCHFTAIRSTTRHVARTYGYHLHVHPASPAAQSPARTPRPATTAIYARGEPETTPMGTGYVAFAKREDAEAFAAQPGGVGQVWTWEEVIANQAYNGATPAADDQ